MSVAHHLPIPVLVCTVAAGLGAQGHHGLDPANLDTTCAPCQDFYRYSTAAGRPPPRRAPRTRPTAASRGRPSGTTRRRAATWAAPPRPPPPPPRPPHQH